MLQITRLMTPSSVILERTSVVSFHFVSIGRRSRRAFGSFFENLLEESAILGERDVNVPFFVSHFLFLLNQFQAEIQVV
jgi:hypothetical protein